MRNPVGTIIHRYGSRALPGLLALGLLAPSVGHAQELLSEEDYLANSQPGYPTTPQQYGYAPQYGQQGQYGYQGQPGYQYDQYSQYADDGDDPEEGYATIEASIDDGYTVDAWQDFEQPLSPYGSWVVDSDYGRVWTPSVSVVGVGFSPYSTGGHWVMTEYGWTWESDWDWGWAPFHYGRWISLNSYGWCWIPGRAWGPGWVSWRNGGGYVGWAPLGPRGVVVGPPAAGISPWRFTTAAQLGSRVNRFVPAPMVSSVWQRTAPIANFRSAGAVRWNAGPTASALARPVSMTPLRALPLAAPRTTVAPYVPGPRTTTITPRAGVVAPFYRSPSMGTTLGVHPGGAPAIRPQGPSFHAVTPSAAPTLRSPSVAATPQLRSPSVSTAPQFRSPSVAPSYAAPQGRPPTTMAPQYRAPSYAAPQYRAPSPTYSAPSYRAAPSYAAPQYRAPSPAYSAPTYRAAPSYSAPQYRAPTYSAPAYRAAPTYSAPTYRAAPSYSAPSYRAAPSYSAPSYRAAPSYSAPSFHAAPSYSAPSFHSAAPSYSRPSAPAFHAAPSGGGFRRR